MKSLFDYLTVMMIWIVPFAGGMAVQIVEFPQSAWIATAAAFVWGFFLTEGIKRGLRKASPHPDNNDSGAEQRGDGKPDAPR